jgi:hypothetical protein
MTYTKRLPVFPLAETVTSMIRVGTTVCEFENCLCSKTYLIQNSVIEILQ